MSSLPSYGFSDLTGNPTDQLGQFETIFEEAKKQGVVSALPESDEETYNFQSQQVRLHTVASRLWLLGYLPNKYKSEEDIQQHLDEIRAAVLVFQKEANLKPDYWVGPKTWHALDELVSFESEFTKEQWFQTDGNLIPEGALAIHRAAELRLFCLGLFDEAPDKFQHLLPLSVFKEFEKILLLFNIPVDFKIGFNFKTLSLLFNQDVLSLAVSKARYENRDAFKFNVKAVVNHTPEVDDLGELKKLGHIFIANCARIELWLLGYEVNFGGHLSRKFQNSLQLKKKDDLFDVIVQFNMHFKEQSDVLSKKMAKRITPSLFQELAVAEDDDRQSDYDEISETIAEKVNTPDQVNKAFTYIKSRGLRLWDGLKRIWRWVKRIGKKVADFIQNNIFKAFFRYISKNYKIIARGFKNVAKAIGNYINGGMPTEGVFFKFSADLDTRVYISNNITTNHQKESILKISRQARAFNLGCQMIGYVINFFKKLVTGLFGWVRFLMTLIKSYKRIKVIYEEFKIVASW